MTINKSSPRNYIEMTTFITQMFYMKKISKYLAILSFTFIVFESCKKKHENICEGESLPPTGKFIMKEIIGDTAFNADTIFRDNYVQFETVDNYESVTWKLGNDPNIRTQPEFNLSFINALGVVPIEFKGNKTPNSLCFPNDNGMYSSNKNLTVLEQVEKPILTLSPLIGRYKGYFTNAPNDTFTVRLEYFDSSKYNTSITSSKNFYWFSNMPNGFVSTLSLPYPELRNGYKIEMGYKSFVFAWDSYVAGKAWLSNDTLFINYGYDFTTRKKFIGKKL
jgi:hypothetical protein